MKPSEMLLEQASPPQSAESAATEEGLCAEGQWQESLRLTQDSLRITKSSRSSANPTPRDRFTPVLNQWIPRASDQARLQNLAKPSGQKKAKLRLEESIFDIGTVHPLRNHDKDRLVELATPKQERKPDPPPLVSPRRRLNLDRLSTLAEPQIRRRPDKSSSLLARPNVAAFKV
ncbi:unnamed protein product [Symbiodinium natans]|uniref:Uncharacterized protein n=1 Tax=Symbiodinium natans TaxID=878477 RepID=A0A812MKD2_9DINO|nr:unnamed protein product [Symbiodinium natans]